VGETHPKVQVQLGLGPRTIAALADYLRHEGA
jgi:hypothetical protein